MRENPLYTFYYVLLAKLVVTDLGPCVIILILNIFIVVKMIKSRQFRSKLLREKSQHDPEIWKKEYESLEKQRQEHKLGMVLMVISVFFIICQSSKVIPDVYEFLVCSDRTEECEPTPFINACIHWSHLLACLNSSANFVIYLLGGKKFRDAWIKTFAKCFSV